MATPQTSVSQELAALIPVIQSHHSRRPRALFLPEVVLFGLCILILWIGIGA
jgi:hypothetical protein